MTEQTDQANAAPALDDDQEYWRGLTDWANRAAYKHGVPFQYAYKNLLESEITRLRRSRAQALQARGVERADELLAKAVELLEYRVGDLQTIQDNDLGACLLPIKVTQGLVEEIRVYLMGQSFQQAVPAFEARGLSEWSDLPKAKPRIFDGTQEEE